MSKSTKYLVDVYVYILTLQVLSVVLHVHVCIHTSTWYYILPQCTCVCTLHGVVLSYCMVLSLHHLFRGSDREVPRVKSERGVFGVVHFGPSEIMTSFGISWNQLIRGYHDIPGICIMPLSHYVLIMGIKGKGTAHALIP